MKPKALPPRQPTWKELVKEYLWPSEPAARAKRRQLYQNVGIFLAASGIFYKFGKNIADLVYDQEMLEDTIRQSMR
jgi:hypothetical protein